MAKKCQSCGRGPRASVSRSHSNIATKRKLNINIQTKRIDGEKKQICTRCIKSLAKVK